MSKSKTLSTWKSSLSSKTIVMARKKTPTKKSAPRVVSALNTTPVERIAAMPDAKTLGSLREGLAGCALCKLCKTRTNIVFGDGNERAKLMFVGEAPGENEDLQGRPFVGRAGQLLEKMIEAMGYQRSDVYIANVVKCRPPSDRDPAPDEIAQCSPFLMRQIETIQPEVIVALGKFAAQTLLQTETPITKLRGAFKAFRAGTREIPLMPTFHPADLLRNPESKREAWEDLKQVRAKLAASSSSQS